MQVSHSSCPSTFQKPHPSVLRAPYTLCPAALSLDPQGLLSETPDPNPLGEHFLLSSLGVRLQQLRLVAEAQAHETLIWRKAPLSCRLPPSLLPVYGLKGRECNRIPALSCRQFATKHLPLHLAHSTNISQRSKCLLPPHAASWESRGEKNSKM